MKKNELRKKLAGYLLDGVEYSGKDLRLVDAIHRLMRYKSNPLYDATLNLFGIEPATGEGRHERK